jgi:hypothetical protein
VRPIVASSLLPTLLAVGLLGSGCGSSHGDKTSEAVGQARLASYARAVNLRASDLPETLREYPERRDRADPDLAPSRCGGGGIVGTATTIHSAGFLAGLEAFGPGRSRPLEAIYSTVQFVASPALARRDVEANRARRVERCVALYVNIAVGQRGPLVDNRASVRTIAASLLPVAGFAFSATDREPFKKAHPPSSRPSIVERLQRQGRLPKLSRGSTTDYLGFAHGRVIVTLFDTHSPEDAPRSHERRLLRPLYERATTHML